MRQILTLLFLLVIFSSCGPEKIDCDKCYKTGKMECPKCEGEGKEKCIYCDGTGKESCSRCYGGVAQLVRAIACHAIGRGFESRHSRQNKCLI